MKKALTVGAIAAFGTLTAFADEAMPELETPVTPTPVSSAPAASMHTMAESVLPWVGIAFALAIAAVVLIIIINKKKQ